MFRLYMDIRSIPCRFWSFLFCFGFDNYIFSVFVEFCIPKPKFLTTYTNDGQSVISYNYRSARITANNV